MEHQDALRGNYTRRDQAAQLILLLLRGMLLMAERHLRHVRIRTLFAP